MRPFSKKAEEGQGLCNYCGKWKLTDLTPEQLEAIDWKCAECAVQRGQKPDDEQQSIERGQKEISKYDPEYEFLVKLVKLVVREGVPAAEVRNLANTYPFHTVDDIGDLTAKIWTLATQKYQIPSEWLQKRLPKSASLKLSQPESGYVDNGKGYTCGRCAYFNKEKETCALVEGTIKAQGCCNYWDDKVKLKEEGTSSNKKEAGYVEYPNVDYRCDECGFFIAKEGKCSKVEGKISPTASCNLWAPISKKTAGQVTQLFGTRVFINPNALQATNAWKASKENFLRYLIDKRGNVYIWDGYYAVHNDMGEGLGLAEDDLWDAGYVNNPSDVRSITNKRNRKADLWPAQEEAEDMLDHHPGYLAYEYGQDKTSKPKRLNLDMVVKILNEREPKVTHIDSGTGTIQLADGTVLSFDDAAKKAMEIDKTGVFSGAEFSTTDFNTNPTLDNGPFSSPEDHGAKPQKKPFPNTNWLPADDEDNDEQPYSNVASSLRPFSKKARMDTPAWIDPSGKTYEFTDNTHDTWAGENAEMLKTQYNLDLSKMNPNTDSAVSYMIDNGWTRAAQADTALVFNTKDINQVNQLDDYVAQHWKPNYKYVLIETFGGNWVVNDPFPTLSKGVQKGKKMAKKADLSGETVNKILNAIHQNGGITFNLSKGDLSGTDNYAVSIHPDRSQILDGIDFDRIEDYVMNNSDLLSNPENSFGAWSHDGKVYLDVVTIIPDINQAVELGKQHNQIAIYDLKNNKEISTGGTGVAEAFVNSATREITADELLSQEDQNQIAADSSPVYVIAVNNYAEALKRGHSKDRSLEYAIESVQNIDKIDAKKLVELINNYL